MGDESTVQSRELVTNASEISKATMCGKASALLSRRPAVKSTPYWLHRSKGSQGWQCHTFDSYHSIPSTTSLMTQGIRLTNRRGPMMAPSNPRPCASAMRCTVRRRAVRAWSTH